MNKVILQTALGEIVVEADGDIKISYNSDLSLLTTSTIDAAMLEGARPAKDWRVSIEDTVLSEHKAPQTLHHYRLPRQVGVSTFLQDFAEHRSQSSNEDVLYLVERSFMLPKGVQYDTGVINSYDYRGRNYDWVLVDVSTSLWSLEQKQKWQTKLNEFAVHVARKNGKILWIESVE